MGLLSAIQSGAKAAFFALGDLKKDCVYESNNPADYDTTTGSAPDVSSKYTLDTGAIMLKFKKSEQGSQSNNKEVRSTDWKALILQADLPIIPNLEGMLTINGSNYKIIDMSEDPASAMWILQVRLV